MKITDEIRKIIREELSENSLPSQMIYRDIQTIENTYGKSKRQKFVIDNVFDFDMDNAEPDYFNKYTKKYLKQIRYVLQNIDILKPIQLLVWIEKKRDYLKTPLVWCLEYLSYKENYDDYLAYYTATMQIYIKDKEEAKKRLDAYIKLISKNISDKSL